jgi:uncharacterized protein (TIGR04255 family)
MQRDDAVSPRSFDKPFPHADRRTLANPPIELIIAQARFPTLAELFSNDGYVAFAAAIRGDFPNASPVSQVALEITPDRVSERGRIPIWQFEDLDSLWTLTLTPDFLALETRQYQSFSAFRDKFCTAWRALTERYQVAHRTRLGLRYVDRFADDKQPNLPTDWLAKVRPDLFPFRDQCGEIKQSGNYEHRFEVDEAIMLTFRYAFRDRAFAGAANSEFVLDLDAFDRSHQPASDISSRLDDLKEVTHNAFWWVFEGLIENIEGATINAQPSSK